MRLPDGAIDPLASQGLERSPVQTPRFIVSIYGPSGSGKSQLANALVARLGDRCSARAPTDYFLMPDHEFPERVGDRALTYDWALLEQRLALPDGAETTTPEFDFARLQRVAEMGGPPFVLRRVIVTDAMAPYPQSDAFVLIAAPEKTRRTRVIARDAIWKSRVHDRWDRLERTWERVQSQPCRTDLSLDGTRAVDENADLLAAWLSIRIERRRGQRARHQTR